MQRLRTVTLAPAALSANAIALSQTPGAAGNLVLAGALATGGVATLDVARRVGITSAADDSGRTFTIYGTNRYGDAQTEALTGANAGLATSLKDFKTVTRIAVDAATAGAVTAGTTGVVSSEWVPVDRLGIQDVGVGVRQTGTANWTIEETYGDPFRPTINQVTDFYLTPYPHGTLVAQSAKKNGTLDNKAITAVRLTLNSFSANASVSADFAPGFVGGGF